MLDSGYLSYFMDQLDEPPFGKDKKGQICLAGYRIVHAGTPGKGERLVVVVCGGVCWSDVGGDVGAERAVWGAALRAFIGRQLRQ